MDKKLIVGVLLAPVIVHYLVAPVIRPDEEPPQSPRLAMIALQSASTSAPPYVIDTILGREFAAAARLDWGARFAFIAASSTLSVEG